MIHQIIHKEACDSAAMLSATDDNVNSTSHIAVHIAIASIEPEVEQAICMMIHQVVYPTTYSFIVDNLDTNVKPRFKRKGSKMSNHFITPIV